jgi:hypothetical protein
LINDVFAKANLQAEVNWTGLEALVGLILVCTTFYAIFSKKAFSHKFILILIGVIITFQLALYWVAPKVERHVQGAMIDFLESKKNEDCYIKALGFKSYAQYYYSDRKPSYNQLMDDENLLVYGKIDKPVYLITKCDRDSYRLIPQLEVVLDKNGWVVYRRLP